MRSTFTLLGILAGALSLFRLCTLAFQMEFSRIAQIIVDFYEAFFHPIVEWIGPFLLGALSVLGIESLPEGWQDYVIIYVVVFFSMIRFLRDAYFRSLDYREKETRTADSTLAATGLEIRTRTPRERAKSVVATGATFGTTDWLRWFVHPVVLFAIDVVLALLWPLFPLLYLIGAWLWGRDYQRRIMPTIIGWLAEIGKVVAGAAIFVLTNVAATAIQ